MEQIITELLLALIPLLVGIMTALLYRYTGIKVEDKHAETLKKALRTGVLVAIEKRDLGDGGAAAWGAIREEVLQHVRSSVPDAISKLNPSEWILDNLGIAELQKVRLKLPLN
jgi:hypothetical protein